MTIIPENRARIPSLEAALESGQVIRDIRRCPVRHYERTKTAIYRGLGKCRCGRPAPILLTVRQGPNPAILYAAVCGESCPDCGTSWKPATVAYAGMVGWPGIPATTVSLADLYLALDLLTFRDQERIWR